MIARATLAFTLDGAPATGRAGDTVASAMVAAGVRAFCHGRDGAPRGPFCGMGVCHDCLVAIDGRPSQRACLTALRAGMAVARQTAPPALSRAAPPPPAGTQSTCDVLIVGAGPAGLEAALACAPGLDVRLLDERSAPGGQYFKQPAAGRGDRQARRGAALVARVRAAGIRITPGATVWGAFRDAAGRLEIAVLTGDAAETIVPRLLIVATGATERPLFVPGWTLPGVMTVGAAQTFLRGNAAVPRGRVAIVGSGPLGLHLACELHEAGARLVAVAEAAPPPWTRPAAALAMLRHAPGLVAQGAAQLARLRAAGVPILHRHALLRLEGAEAVEAVVLAGPDGRERRIAADVVALSGGFAPADGLARLLGAEAADVLVAGEAAGFGGAQVARAEGRLAGLRARILLGRPAGSDRPARRALARHRAFQAALWRLFAAPDPGLSRADADTLVCRCEAVTLGTLRAAIARHGLTDPAALKRVTRAGMGRCQGRLCGPALASLFPGAPSPPFAPQVPLLPVPVATLAAEAPEWRGHRRTALPVRRPPAPVSLPVAEAQTVVVGGGIAGLSTAWFLARAGHEVLLLDRGVPGAEASGGNAGSLHVQLLSFDFATGDDPASPAARTLALQRDAVALWHALAPDLGPIELRGGGGLMVAETAAELAALRAKAALERRCGIDSVLIDPGDLYRREPVLAPGLLGAVLCPDEGKVNPLLANQAIEGAARAAGALIAPHVEVQAIRRAGAGFVLETSSGPVRAGRVVNAAGAWAARVAALLEAPIPVFGAPLQMIVTEPAAPTVSHLLAHAGRHLTLKQAATGGFLIGGGWSAGLDPAGAHPRPLRESLGGNLAAACRVLPGLGSLHVVRSWAAMNIDIDGAPIIGPDPRVPGLFHAVGANGYTLGPLLGRITAELILARDPGHDIALFSARRFAHCLRA